ncbi:DNA repair exonuclease [Roseibacillus persicicus]|uniref:metallophosphoesterase family protein n=1 Tax=Roseibacillus persicicus TaxID=454148 RepID=UPI00398AA411
MFTFLHAADLHLDSPLTGLSKHEDAPVEAIKQATREALSRLVDLAIDKEVVLVVIAGDLYDGSWKDFSTGLFFVKEMRRLRDAGILVYLISGNHDAESQLTKSLTLPENVHHFSSRKASSIPHPTLPVTLHGQSFATPSVTDNLAAGYPAPAKERLNIGLLHTNLGDAEGHGNYAPSTVPQLIAHGYQYWALGHIHQRQVHHEHPHIIYPGNTQGRHVKETGAKGCYLVTVDEQLEVSHCQFHALDCVRWEQLQIDCSSLTDEAGLTLAIRQALEQAIASSEGRLLCTRLILTGHTSLHEILHADHARWQAECQSLALDLGPDLVWLEQVKVKTSTRIDPTQLAQQDELTALVLDSLTHFNPGELPTAVSDLQGKIPVPARDELAPQFEPDESTTQDLRDDIAAIVLHAIATAE